jgi:hypothetical protein
LNLTLETTKELKRIWKMTAEAEKATKRPNQQMTITLLSHELHSFKGILNDSSWNRRAEILVSKFSQRADNLAANLAQEKPNYFQTIS